MKLESSFEICLKGDITNSDICEENVYLHCTIVNYTHRNNGRVRPATLNYK